MFILASKQKIRNLVKSNYEQIAEDFDMTRQKELSVTLYDLSKEVNLGEKVLDMASGNGRLLKALPADVFYEAFDLSEKLLSLAKEKYPQRDFSLGDLADKNTWPEGIYDHLFCLAAFHHLVTKKERLDFLINCQEKLKPQGRLVLSVWDLRGQKRFWFLILKSFLFFRPFELIFSWKKNKSPRYYHAFSKRELVSLIKKSGLKKEKFFKANGNLYVVSRLEEI